MSSGCTRLQLKAGYCGSLKLASDTAATAAAAAEEEGEEEEVVAATLHAHATATALQGAEREKERAVARGFHGGIQIRCQHSEVVACVAH